MIRKLLFTIFLILAFAVPGWGATYTVCGAGCDETAIQDVFDNNDLAGDDIVEVRAAAPGGTVTFREMVTIGANDLGTSGHQITLQGRSGDTVVINGSDLITTWTGAYLTANTETPNNDQAQAANVNIRNIWPANTSSYSGSKVRITITAHSSSNTVLAGCSIGVAEVSGNEDFDAAPTRITFDVGSSSTTVTAGSTKVSDEITFTFDKTKRHLIQMYWDGGVAQRFYINGPGGDITDGYAEWGSGVDKTMVADITKNLDLTVVTSVSKIEIYNAALNLWEATATTEPSAAFFDGTYGSEAANVDAVDAAREWFWASNILYVYSSGGDPDTEYTDPGIEAAVRNFCIDGSDREYLTFKDLTLEKAKTSNLRVDKQTNGGGIVIDTVISNNAGTHGFHIDGESAKINNVTIMDSTVNDYARDSGATTYRGIYLDGSGGDNFTVQRCLIDADFVGPDTNGNRNGIEVITGNDTLIEENEVTGTDHGIVMLGATSQDWIIRYNYVHDTADDNFFTDDLNDADGMIHNNIGAGSADNGIDMRDSANGGTVANNVFYDSTKQTFMVTGAGLVVTFKNNIVYRVTETTDDFFIYHSSPVNSTFDNNVYYDESGYCVGAKFAAVGGGGGETFATWQARIQDVDSLNVNPLMTDPGSADFTLQSTSPCIDAGTIPTGFEAIFPLDPRDTTFPYDSLNRDYGDREIGLFGYMAMGGIPGRYGLGFFGFF